MYSPKVIDWDTLEKIRDRQWRRQYLIGAGQEQEQSYSCLQLERQTLLLGVLWRHFCFMKTGSFCIWNQASVQAKCHSPSHIKTSLFVRGKTKLIMGCENGADLCRGLRPELLPSMYIVWIGLEGSGNHNSSSVLVWAWYGCHIAGGQLWCGKSAFMQWTVLMHYVLWFP